MRDPSLRALCLLAVACAVAACGDDSTGDTGSDAIDTVDATDGAPDASPDASPDTSPDASPDGLPDGVPDGDADVGEDGPGPTACETYCGPVVAAGCDAGPATFDGCLASCDGMAEVCAAEFGALLACGGETPAFSCNADDLPQAVGCETRTDAFYACAIDGPCGALCPAVVAAGCSSGPPALDDCMAGCGEVVLEGCAVEMAELADCGGAPPTVTCDPSSGMPRVAGCDAEQTALDICIGY